MPSAWTNVDANFPTITQDGDVREQISAIYNYMYSLTEELKYTLENLDKTNWNTTAMEKFTGEFTTQIKAVDGEVVRALSLIEGLNESITALQQKTEQMNTTMQQQNASLTNSVQQINNTLNSINGKIALLSGNSNALTIGGTGKRIDLNGEIYINGVKQQ